MTTLKERLDHLAKIAWNTPQATVTEKALAQEEYQKLKCTPQAIALRAFEMQLNGRWQKRLELQKSASKAQKEYEAFLADDKTLETAIAIIEAVACPKLDA